MRAVLKSRQQPRAPHAGWASRAAGRSLLDDLPCSALTTTKVGRLRSANRAAVELLGLDAADSGRDLLGQLGATAVDRVGLERRLALLRARRLGNGRVRLGSVRAGQRSLVWRVTARRDARGRLIGFVALAESSAVLRGLERRVALSEQRLADFAANAPDWFWETDARHRFSYLSERIETVTGVARTSPLGRSRTEVMAVSVRPEFVGRHAADLAALRPFHDLTYDLAVDGRRRSIRVSGRPVFGEDGRFLG